MESFSEYVARNNVTKDYVDALHAWVEQEDTNAVANDLADADWKAEQEDVIGDEPTLDFLYRQDLAMAQHEASLVDAPEDAEAYFIDFDLMEEDR